MTFSDKFKAFREFAGKAWRLSTPYFSSDEKWKARALLAAIVALNLGAVYMLVLINEWNRVFYDALQNKDAAVFWRELGRFTYLAFGFIVIAVYRFYLTQLLEMRWRSWMTRRSCLASWSRPPRSAKSAAVSSCSLAARGSAPALSSSGTRSLLP